MDSAEEEADTFTAEYRKILEQLPSMLKPTEPIPQHLQNYIKPYQPHTQSKRKYKKHKTHNRSNTHNISNGYLSHENDDFITIQQLKKINETLSQHKKTVNISTQTDEITDEIIIEKKCNSIAVQTIDIETDTKANIETENTKINSLISKLTNELNMKSNECSDLKEDNILLENETKELKKELMKYKLEINEWKQQISDQNIYNINLVKHLDEKSRNEALLRKEMNELTKQLENAYFKLEKFTNISINNKNNRKEINEIKELREHLIISEQKCLDWKKKWKIQCYKIEQFESEKIMSQHRIDKQLGEYQKIIQDFRNIMKNNLTSVNINFKNLNNENIFLKNENEKLLFELGKIQENTFKNTYTRNNNLNKKNNQIVELTEKLTTFESNLHKNHLNGTMDKGVQCINDCIDLDDNNNNNNNEFNKISIEIYELIINLQTKSCDIVNEYSLTSLSNSPTNNNKCNKYNIEYTDDIDITSVIINCKKRFYEIKQIIQQLLQWFDDIMYKQAENQCDRCITQ